MTIAWYTDTATSIASHPRSGPKIICVGVYGGHVHAVVLRVAWPLVLLA